MCKVYSVKLKGLVEISDKALKAIAFDGSECILPKSQVFGPDINVKKSDAYWIAAWILENKNLQYSCKKVAWFDKKTRKIKPAINVTVHVPDKIDINIKYDESLFK